MNFQYSPGGLALTESFEGYSDVAYPDSVSGAEPWTIGYGHTVSVQPGDTCTKDQAEQWLLSDVQAVCDAINRDCTWPNLTQDEFDALVDFGFNLGMHALEGSTLWRLLMAGDVAGAAAQFPDWDMAGGHVVKGLLNRRQAEESLFLEGSPHGPDTDNSAGSDSGQPAQVPADDPNARS